MKNKTGMIVGFIIGVPTFLMLFRVIFLDRIPPSDELAPGIVMLAAIMNGLVFAFIGSRIQHYFVKKRDYKM
ncbi:MAG: hypothetical protein QM802_24515 [Agriterribacter sp.]